MSLWGIKRVLLKPLFIRQGVFHEFPDVCVVKNYVSGALLLFVAPDSKSDKDLNPGSRSLGSIGDIPPQRGRPTSNSIA